MNTRLHDAVRSLVEPDLRATLVGVALLIAPLARAQPAPSVQRLVEDLGDNDAQVRSEAAAALGAHGAEAAPAVPALVTALMDHDRSVRFCAAEALGDIGPEAAPAIPALVAALSDGEDVVRTGAASGLSKIGADAVPALIAVLTSQKGAGELRGLAAYSLEGMGAQAAPAVPALVVTLTGESTSARANAARAHTEGSNRISLTDGLREDRA